MATDNTQQEHDVTAERSDVAVSRETLRKLNHVLDKSPQQSIDVTLEPSGESITLPRHVARELREVLKNAAVGQPISIVPEHAELTTQQAADLLNVSRPYVVKLIDEGTLPGHKVGAHRRVYASDVEEYKRARDITTCKAADELTALSEEMRLYHPERSTTS
ncbi:helix-turn-helix domain-containing protein [Corynebacterium sp.]|uniref:helix-turn-helix domain-containing protein n=1 Tax=Corynebacterium sp. TaxID=1720 RepID=UPI0026DBB21B|nr:helix-turn-helix domain-containing protein [Corynebacterium sp.]MDO4915039.1 helix-turn-helix domain-containing protein [Corynebacterium sp.]